MKSKLSCLYLLPGKYRGQSPWATGRRVACPGRVQFMEEGHMSALSLPLCLSLSPLSLSVSLSFSLSLSLSFSLGFPLSLPLSGQGGCKEVLIAVGQFGAMVVGDKVRHASVIPPWAN